MNTKKIIKTVSLVIAVILVVLIAAFFLIGDYAIKMGVEKGGSAALGVPVKVDGVHLSVLRGMVTLKGLQVENPPGYHNKYLLEVGSGKVAVNIFSLLKDTIHVSDITFDGISLDMEQKGLGTNVNELLNNIKAKEQPSEEKKPAPEEKGKKAGKKLVIDQLNLTNTQAKMAMNLGKSGGVTLKLAPIQMKNLGADKPLSIAELTAKIFVALIAGVAQQGAGLLPPDAVNSMKGGVIKISEIGGESGKAIIDSGSKAIEGFKGLFAPKKK